MIKTKETTMQDLINKCGEEYLEHNKDYHIPKPSKPYKYKGLIITKHRSDDSNIIYFTIVNPKNQQHSHSNSFGQAKMICDCFQELKLYGICCDKKYSRSTRNRALRLLGYVIK